MNGIMTSTEAVGTTVPSNTPVVDTPQQRHLMARTEDIVQFLEAVNARLKEDEMTGLGQEVEESQMAGEIKMRA